MEYSNSNTLSNVSSSRLLISLRILETALYLMKIERIYMGDGCFSSLFKASQTASFNSTLGYSTILLKNKVMSPCCEKMG
jgi:hypothetical protein